MSRESQTAPATGILTARERIIAETHEWLGRAANLMNVVRSDFPNKALVQRNHLDSRNHIMARSLESPRIILPARPVESFTSSGSIFTRRIAATLELRYADTELAAVDLAAIKRLEQPAPAPQAVFIGNAHPVALPSDASRAQNLKYQWDDATTIGGQVPDLYSWCVGNFGADLDVATLFMSLTDEELCNFETFRDYPAEALVQRPDSIDYHQGRLDRFIDTLGEIALAINNPELNPR